MGFIKAGFTGGFLGIVISVSDIFVNSPILEKLSSLGRLLASQFGKVCINTGVNECTLAEKFTTILATIVGNTIAYFLVFALISLGISVIVMWFTPSKKTETIIQQAPQVTEQPQVIVQQPPAVVQETQEAKPKSEKKAKEKRPKKKAKVRKK